MVVGKVLGVLGRQQCHTFRNLMGTREVHQFLSDEIAALYYFYSFSHCDQSLTSGNKKSAYVKTSYLPQKYKLVSV